MPSLEVQIWSDIACPWCYVGKRRFEAALAATPGRAAVAVRRRSFELDPAAPREKEPGVPYAERLARKYGSSREHGAEMIRTMTAAGAEEGLELRFDRIRPGSTFDAHRLLHRAAADGLDAELEERLFRAYLTEGAAIGDPETLARLAAEAGLDAEAARGVLAGDAFAGAVRADEAEAARLGIRGVPCFVIGGRTALSGAQPPAVIAQGLGAALEALGDAPGADRGSAGGASDPEGCA